jgi:5-methylthioadenosine/S-adenosylhomocysteine deaminase
MNENATDLLISNGIVITMNAERLILDPGYVAIRGTHIQAVGAGEPDDDVRATRHIDAGGGIVHPGLIDAHAHAGWGLARSWTPLEAAEAQSYEEREVPLSGAITPADEEVGACLASAEMLLGGTTCFADTGSSLDVEPVSGGAEAAGIRAMVASFIADEAPALARINSSTEDALARIERNLERWPSGGKVWACAGLLGGNYVSDRLVAEAKALANEHGAQLNVHKSSRREEVERARSRVGGDPLVAFRELGVLDERTTLVHVNYCNERELEALVETGTAVVHCPAASRLYGLGVGSSQGRVPELLAAGAPVALGSDASLFGNRWGAMSQAALVPLLHRDGTERRIITSENALEMATLGGAKAIGRAHELGALVPGMLADVVVHKARAVHLHPLVDVVNALVLSARESTVDTVIVDGEVVVEQGRLTRLSTEMLLEESERAGRELHARAGVPEFTRWPVARTAVSSA